MAYLLLRLSEKSLESLAVVGCRTGLLDSNRDAGNHQFKSTAQFYYFMSGNFGAGYWYYVEFGILFASRELGGIEGTAGGPGRLCLPRHRPHHDRLE